MQRAMARAFRWEVGWGAGVVELGGRRGGGGRWEGGAEDLHWGLYYDVYAGMLATKCEADPCKAMQANIRLVLPNPQQS